MSTPARLRLSVAIVAKNEEANLRRILPSVAALADEIVLVDSGSTDGTVALAQSFGARVLHQEWLGFGQQKNFAISKCTNEWILSLDADEIVSPALAASISQALSCAASDLAGFTLPRLNYFLGRPMLHGGMYPDRKLRLFRKGQAFFQDRAVHESMLAHGRLKHLKGDLHHYAAPPRALDLEHMNRYSSAGVSLVLERGKRSRSVLTFLSNTVVNPLATFAYNYGLRGGFLDGREGLLLHLYHSCYVSWKYSKAWEQARARSGE